MTRNATGDSSQSTGTSTKSYERYLEALCTVPWAEEENEHQRCQQMAILSASALRRFRRGWFPSNIFGHLISPMCDWLVSALSPAHIEMHTADLVPIKTADERYAERCSEGVIELFDLPTAPWWSREYLCIYQARLRAVLGRADEADFALLARVASKDGVH